MFGPGDQASQFVERSIDSLGKSVGAAESLQRFWRHKLEQEVGCTGRQSGKVNR